MNGIDYLADTNCFIYLLDQHPLLLPFTESNWCYSFITEMELLSKKTLNAKQDSTIRNMLAACSRISQTQELTELTIGLRKKYSLKLPDAIIAASAQQMALPILTADKLFSSIREVDVILLEV